MDWSVSQLDAGLCGIQSRWGSAVVSHRDVFCDCEHIVIIMGTCQYITTLTPVLEGGKANQPKDFLNQRNFKITQYENYNQKYDWPPPLLFPNLYALYMLIYYSSFPIIMEQAVWELQPEKWFSSISQIEKYSRNVILLALSTVLIYPLHAPRTL